MACSAAFGGGRREGLRLVSIPWCIPVAAHSVLKGRLWENQNQPLCGSRCRAICGARGRGAVDVEFGLAFWRFWPFLNATSISMKSPGFDFLAPCNFELQEAQRPKLVLNVGPWPNQAPVLGAAALATPEDILRKLRHFTTNYSICDDLSHCTTICDNLRHFRQITIVCHNLRHFATNYASFRNFATICDILRCFT